MAKTEAVNMEYRALNPSGLPPEVKIVPLAPRISEINGRVVYCVSQYMAGADIFLKKVADTAPGYAPGIKTVYKKKIATYMTDEPELWDEIANEADALIYGCGG